MLVFLSWSSRRKLVNRLSARRAVAAGLATLLYDNSGTCFTNTVVVDGDAATNQMMVLAVHALSHARNQMGQGIVVQSECAWPCLTS